MLTNPAPNLCYRIKLLVREQLLCTEYRVQGGAGEGAGAMDIYCLMDLQQTSALTILYTVYSARSRSTL